METQQYRPAPPTNGKAIASMVIGILSIIIVWLGVVLGIIGIVLANRSLKEITATEQGGRGMAIAGLTTSIIGTSIHGILLFFMLISLITFRSAF
ncbi:hypothetical protein J2T56_002384 [Natronobacillus azotifigens]|uniref:DUF4190 domain-containing protein n=1 Tax=Natronobacillus azotifigens TaxID=472978 RepID=A0A9J6RG51_9BACI|nr:DUF4190 domain-containing protein [Natronobacillus azotifigens]MCZ0704137.1 DUF4190 domain-containing protein [Natronobacillus azotifigens]